MSERRINLSKELDKYLALAYADTNIKIPDKYATYLVAYGKEVARKVLELAAENAMLSYAEGRFDLPAYAEEPFNAVVDDLGNAKYIDKQSILNTINQIE